MVRQLLIFSNAFKLTNVFYNDFVDCFFYNIYLYNAASVICLCYIISALCFHACSGITNTKFVNSVVALLCFLTAHYLCFINALLLFCSCALRFMFL